MRFSVAAVALCFSLLAFAAVYTAASRAATTAPAPPSPPAPSPPAPSPADSADAAAKHAKLTACLKDAKVRKLVGAAKTAFVKECTSKP